MKLALVVSKFNTELTSRMRKVAEEHAKKRNIEIIMMCEVPGAYDTPFAVQKALENKEVEGVAVLGAIIKGSTNHDVLIAHSTASALTKLSLHHRKPVSLGIIGPDATWDQAESRAEEYAERAVDAAFELSQL